MIYVLVLPTVTSLLLIPSVLGCNRQSGGDGTTTTAPERTPNPITLPPPPPQKITPSPPPAVVSTCGHSMYYHAENNAGAGIVGGIEALPNQYPWMVRLRIVSGTNILTCGASIVSDNWILTSARCAKITPIMTDYTAIIGDVDTTTEDKGEYALGITNITVHQLYHELSRDYDFAVMKLSNSLNFTADWKTQSICLPQECKGECSVSTIAYIAGWGVTSESSSNTSPPLRTGYIKISDQDDCSAQYKGTATPITDRMICAGWKQGGVDTCSGDLGGPLMVIEDGYYKICGIASFGIGCGRSHFLGVYSKVCTVLDWINPIIATA